MDDQPFKLRYRPRKGAKPPAPKPRAAPKAPSNILAMRLAIRAKLDAGEPIDGRTFCKEFGVSHYAAETATAFERGRLEGLEEAAPINMISRRKLAKELGPIIKVIRAEGRKPSVLIAPSVLLRAASDLGKLMETMVPITGIAADSDAPVLSVPCPQESIDGDVQVGEE